MAKLGEANIGGRMVPAWLLNLTAEKLDSLKWYSNPNLLRNAYFVGGGSQQGGGQFPINQRGQTSYANVNSIMYGIDMWILDWNTTLTLASGYVSMTGNGIFQALPSEKISLITGKTVTLSALDVSGNLHVVTGVYDENTSQLGNDTIMLLKNYGGKSAVIRIISSGIVAAKLELGDYQTLAYQDEDGNWQLFETPDYGEELAKCQRYFYRYVGDILLCNYVTGEGFASFEFPVEMRITPTVTIDSYNPNWGVPDARAINSHGLAFHSTSNGGIVTQFTASAEL